MDEEPEKTNKMSPVKANEEQFAQQFQPNDNDKFPIELTTTGRNLQHFDEDCLLKIFAVKSLTLMDLCSLAESCTRLQRITERVVPKDLNIKIWPDQHCDVASRKYLRSKNLQPQDIERILKNFGSFLSEVSISSTLCVLPDGYSEPSRFVLNLVTDYCVDNLKILKIRDSKISPVLANKMRLFREENFTAVLGNDFPKLEAFIYEVEDDFHQPPITQSLTNFISRHTSLKTLHIDTGEVGEQEKVLKVVGSSCKELTEFSMKLNEWNFELGPTRNVSFLQPLQAFQSLKTLKLQNASKTDFNFIQTLTTLSELHLINCRLPTDVNQFGAMVQLTKLYIKGKISGSFVVGLVRRLTNLEELTVSGSWKKEFVLDEKSFSKIVAAIKGRPALLTLRCKFNFNSESCDEKQKVRLLPLPLRIDD